MPIDIAVVPVAGLGTRLLPATKSQPKEMLPVGRRPVVQYVVEELTRVGVKRVLFITGPGKASIENHFDLNTRADPDPPRERARRSCSPSSRSTASTCSTSSRASGSCSAWATPCCAPARWWATSRSSWRSATRSSACTPQSDVVERMTRCFAEKGAAAVIAFEEVAEDEVHQYGIAAPRGTGDVFEIADLVEKPSQAGGAEQPRDCRALRPVARDLRRARPDHAGQGWRDPAHRRDPRRHQGGRPRVRRPAGRARSAATTSATSTRTSAPSSSSRWPTRGTAPPCASTWSSSSMFLTRKRAYARAGLLGNPSDGYNGKTISISVRNFWAEVVLYEWDTVEIVLADDDRAKFASVTELARDVRLHGYYGGIRLIKATIKRFVEYLPGAAGCALHDRNFSVRYQTSIPRQVGMAGSSALIVRHAALPDGVLRDRDPARGAAHLRPAHRAGGVADLGRAAGSRHPGVRGHGLHGLRHGPCPRRRRLHRLRVRADSTRRCCRPSTSRITTA